MCARYEYENYIAFDVIFTFKCICMVSMLKSIILLTNSCNDCFTLTVESPCQVSCPSEKVGTKGAYGIFEWPQTSPGDHSTVACPYNRESSASRGCLYSNTTGRGVWSASDVKQCKYKNKQSKILFDLTQVTKHITKKARKNQYLKVETSFILERCQ